MYIKMNVHSFILLLLSYLTISFCFIQKENEDATEISFSDGDVALSKKTAIINLDTSEVVIEVPGIFYVTGKSDEGNAIITSSSVNRNLVNLRLSSTKKSPIIILKGLEDIHINILENTIIRDLENEKTTERGCSAIQIKSNSIVYFKNDDILTLYGDCKNVIKGGYQTSVTF